MLYYMVGRFLMMLKSRIRSPVTSSYLGNPTAVIDAFCLIQLFSGSVGLSECQRMIETLPSAGNGCLYAQKNTLICYTVKNTCRRLMVYSDLKKIEKNLDIFKVSCNNVCLERSVHILFYKCLFQLGIQTGVFVNFELTINTALHFSC